MWLFRTTLFLLFFSSLGGCWYNPHCSDTCLGSTQISIQATGQFENGIWQRFHLETQSGLTECIYNPASQPQELDCEIDKERRFELERRTGFLYIGASFAFDWLKLTVFLKDGTKNLEETIITTKQTNIDSYPLCESVGCPKAFAEVELQ